MARLKNTRGLRVLAVLAFVFSGGLFYTVYQAKSTGCIATGGRYHQHWVYEASSPTEFTSVVRTDSILGTLFAAMGVVLFCVASIRAAREQVGGKVG